MSGWTKVGWFWISFVVWLFIMVIILGGCTPLKKAEASEHCVLQYDILQVRHDSLLLGESDLNAAARQGWRVIEVDWLKSGTILYGFYTLERCE